MAQMFPGKRGQALWTTDPEKCRIYPAVPRVLDVRDLIGRALVFIKAIWLASDFEKAFIHPDKGKAYGILLCRDVETKAEFSVSTGSIRTCSQLYNHELLGHFAFASVLENVENPYGTDGIQLGELVPVTPAKRKLTCALSRYL